MNSIADLLARLEYSFKNPEEAKPLALLLGSGVSVPAVRDVSQILASLEKMFQGQDLVDFNRALEGLDNDGLRYQAAFQFMSSRRPPKVREKVVRAAVLAAYPPAKPMDVLPNDPETLNRFEEDVDNWSIPRGLAALGRIWAGLSAVQRGPILTTNFDPLVELAIRRSGVAAESRWMDADGSFINSLALTINPNVVHLHGFWRDSNTLNAATQLTVDRPALAGSLRKMLSKYTLLVVGYSGWEDSFMQQFRRIVDEQSESRLDILWAFYASQDSVRGGHNDSLLRALQRAPGNVVPYFSVDANKLFPELEQRVQEVLRYTDLDRRLARSATLAGWTNISEAMANHRTEDELVAGAITFFDGREPNYFDALNPYIPARNIVDEVVNQILARPSECSLTRILGAGGEGKSMALLQIARRLAEKDHAGAVYLSQDGTVLDAEAIWSLPSGKTHYFLVDCAYRATVGLKEICRGLNSRGRSDVHIVTASRDTDWISAGGTGFPWSKYVTYRPKTLRGVSRVDALAVVAAWEKLGPGALGELRFVRGRENRVNEFVRTSQDSSLCEDGSFFGGVLATRFGGELQTHIDSLVERLLDREVITSQGVRRTTLAEALVAVSIPHSIGILTLPTVLLADIFEVPVDELRFTLLSALGEEAPVSADPEVTLTRHMAVARAVVRAWRGFGNDEGDMIGRLVAAAVRRIDRFGSATRGLVDIAYMSRNFAGERPCLIAARAAVEANPRRLSYRSRLSSALRGHGYVAEALEVCRVGAIEAHYAPDFASGIRLILNEVGVCKGVSGHLSENLYYTGRALSDLAEAPLSLSSVEFPLACLANAVEKFYGVRPDVRLQRAMRGILYFLARLATSGLSGDWISRYESVGGSAEAIVSANVAADAIRQVVVDFGTPVGLIPALETGSPTFTQLADLAM